VHQARPALLLTSTVACGIATPSMGDMPTRKRVISFCTAAVWEIRALWPWVRKTEPKDSAQRVGSWKRTPRIGPWTFRV
jgi:hypothetical protein